LSLTLLLALKLWSWLISLNTDSITEPWLHSRREADLQASILFRRTVLRLCSPGMARCDCDSSVAPTGPALNCWVQNADWVLCTHRCALGWAPLTDLVFMSGCHWPAALHFITDDYRRLVALFQGMLYGFHYVPESLHNFLGLGIECLCFFVCIFFFPSKPVKINQRPANESCVHTRTWLCVTPLVS
jgi:hypothetical protein